MMLYEQMARIKADAFFTILGWSKGAKKLL